MGTHGRHGYCGRTNYIWDGRKGGSNRYRDRRKKGRRRRGTGPTDRSAAPYDGGEAGKPDETGRANGARLPPQSDGVELGRPVGRDVPDLQHHGICRRSEETGNRNLSSYRDDSVSGGSSVFDGSRVIRILRRNRRKRSRGGARSRACGSTQSNHFGSLCSSGCQRGRATLGRSILENHARRNFDWVRRVYDRCRRSKPGCQPHGDCTGVSAR